MPPLQRRSRQDASRWALVRMKTVMGSDLSLTPSRYSFLRASRSPPWRATPQRREDCLRQPSREQPRDRSVPRDLCRDRPAGTAEGGCVLAMLPEPARRTSELVRVGRHDETRPAVGDHLERTSSIGRREHGLLREEGLERDHPVVLVQRGVVDRETAAVEVGELLFRDTPSEPGPPVEPPLAREPLEALAVGAVAGDHDLEP